MAKAKRQVFASCFYVVLFFAPAVGQSKAPWPCIDEVAKAESGGNTIRLSAGVARRLAQKQILPDVSDLKGKKARGIDSLVIINVIVDTKGNVRYAQPEQGDADLYPRSIDAAQQWKFTPFQMHNETLVVSTHVQFKFKKDKVEIVFPGR